jgi:hypothetical protein
MDFDLRFSAAFWIPFGIALFALSFTLFVYRHTNPASSNLLRRFLAALRYAALAALVFLLFEPVLAMRWTASREPTIAVLIDESASMTLADSTTRRGDRVKELLRGSWLREMQKNGRLALLAFADTLRAITPDSTATMRFAGGGTDIAAALSGAQKRLVPENFSAAILISDGITNLGENPARVAEHYSVPVYTVGIGSPKRAKDVVLTQVITNDIGYANTQLPVDITIAAVGYGGRAARLRLDDQAGRLVEQQVILPSDNTQITTRLSLTPRHLGMNKLTVSIEAQTGETSELNNRRTAFVRVLESKVRLWMIAGSPSADYEFAKRVLDEDRNFTVTGFVQKPDGAFYAGRAPVAQGVAWQEVDCLIFIDFPRKDSDTRMTNALAQALAHNKKPVFWMAGPNTDPSRWWSFQKQLPLSAKPVRTAENQVAMMPEAAGLSHPLGRFAESPDENRELWKNLPPVFSSFTEAQIAPSLTGQILAVADPATARVAAPLLIAQKNADAKVILLLAHGLWRWHMKLVGIGKSPVAYRHVIAQGVRWLVTREDSKLVRFATNKVVYRGGEPVEMTAQVYFEDYRPRPGARVSARLSGPGVERDIVFEEIGDGLYRASPGSLPGGDFELRGRAEAEGRLIGEDVAKFSVEPFSVEYISTAMNEPLLRKIAGASGGRYLSPDSLALFAARVKFPAQQLEQRKEIAAWGRPWVLAIVVGFLGVEWFLRKQHGML